MFRITALSLLLFVTTSCSLDSGKEPVGNNPGNDGRFIQPLQPERFLTELELARLTRLCRATTRARERADSYFDRDLQYLFSLQQRNCGSSAMIDSGNGVAIFRRPLTGSPYLETLGSVRIIEDLLFDSHPYLSVPCTRLNNNQSVSNQYSDGTDRLLYEYVERENMDTLIVTRYRVQSNGDVLPATVDSYKVYTEAMTRNENILGNVYERSQTLACQVRTQTQVRFQRLNQIQQL